MNGYASIGTLYSLREKNSDERLLFAVIENNLNNKTSTLLVVGDCPENGKKAKVDAEWLNGVEPVGPILPPAGEIVIENGIEFIKPVEKKAKYKIFKIFKH